MIKDFWAQNAQMKKWPRYGYKKFLLKCYLYGLVVAFAPALAQVPVDTLDIDFKVQELYDRVAQISAAVPVNNGSQILVAGGFDYIDGVRVSNLVRFNLDGSIDTSFRVTIKPNIRAKPVVNDMQVLGDGKILIAGAFNAVNGRTASGIARLNSDGSFDTDFTPPTIENRGAPSSNEVNSIAIQADGKLLIGGSFDHVSGQPRTALARLLSTGELDSSFVNSQISECCLRSPIVSTVAVQPSGKLLISGGFKNIAGTSRRGFARLNPDGSLDTAFDTAVSPSIAQIKVLADGAILLGGSISIVDEVSVSNLAKLTVDGELVESFNPNVNSRVEAITLLANGELLIGGSFNAVDDEAFTGGLAKLNAAGEVTGELVANWGAVTAIAVVGSSKVLIGGFLTPSGFGRDQIRLISLASGADDNNFVVNQVDVLGGLISRIVPGGKDIYIFGFFTRVQGFDRPSFARLRSNGSVDRGFAPIPDSLGGIDDVEVLPNSKMLVTGSFTTIDNINKPHLARLNSDGSVDQTFTASPSITWIPRQIERVSTTEFLLGGPELERYRENGEKDQSFTVDFNGSLEYFLLQSDGKILMSGSFTEVNGVPMPYLARLNTDGSLDASFNPPVIANGGAIPRVIRMVIQQNNQIVISGNFREVGATPHRNIARLNSDGSLDEAFTPMTNLFGIQSLVLLPDQSLIVAGGFTEVNEQSRGSIARLRPDGSLTDDFSTPINLLPTSSNGVVNDIVLDDDGRLLVGGDFFFYGDTQVSKLIRLGTPQEFCSIVKASNNKIAAFCL